MQKQKVTLLVMLVLVLSVMLGSGSGISGPSGEKPLSQYQIDKPKFIINGKELRVCECSTFLSPKNSTGKPGKLIGKLMAYRMDEYGNGCIPKPMMPPRKPTEEPKILFGEFGELMAFYMDKDGNGCVPKPKEATDEPTFREQSKT